ncbi:MAG: hypothetical protein AB7P11_05250 [Hydrogenophaga sp.]|uniref:hypothetical protein n=1 Tax=Hydrogenophaga sp. TaxID=1904254 RepID=UPI003D14DCD8
MTLTAIENHDQARNSRSARATEGSADHLCPPEYANELGHGLATRFDLHHICDEATVSTVNYEAIGQLVVSR